MKFLNKNDYFDVNPYNNKSIELGKSTYILIFFPIKYS